MLRLGLLSTARINGEIIRAASESDIAQVVAVASRDAARATEYARAHGISSAHGSYEDLLTNPGVDAVYISLPNALHHEWTMRALGAGKHVLCEKPYSRKPADVDEAFATASTRGLVLMEAFMYRHHPQMSIASELVADGSIGRLRSIRATFTFRLEQSGDVRLRPELAGGSLMDVGCYCLSGARLFAGEPLRAEGEQVLAESGVDIAFHGILRFPDDVVGQIDCSFVTPRFQRLEAVGDEGSLLVQAPWRADWGGEVFLERDGGVSQVEVPFAASFVRELENFAGAVGGTESPLLGREDALGQARAIDALYRAAETGASVSL